MEALDIVPAAMIIPEVEDENENDGNSGNNSAQAA